ncbi:prenyltransferase [Acidilobus sp. 7A]|uniref:prenyltransferase n=1 Tax=Acidilobus sp. 7A TaxID=1577685 RepID=UPI000E3E5C53|nr:prenyltransferase [Acidilobus sp. 7A]
MSDGALERVRAWANVIRVKFFAAGIPPVILGFALAYYLEGLFSPLLFALTMLGIIAAMIGSYTFNEYFDFRSGVDLVVDEMHVTPFNSGSRVLPSGLLNPERVFQAGLAAAAATAAVGLYLALARGSLVLLLTAVGLVAALGYTAPPLKFAYRGLGELMIGLSFGPLITLGSYLVQTGRLGVTAVLASLVPGLLITAVIWINEFPDYEADRAVGKRNMVARLGKRRALLVYPWLFALGYAVVVAGVALRLFPVYALLALLTTPMAVRAVANARRNMDSPKGLVPSMSGTIAVFVLSTLLLSLGLAMARWI